MSLKIRFGRRQFAALFGAALAIACGYCLHNYGFGTGLARLSYDLLLAARGDVATDEAVIVYLDEESFDRLHQPKNAPWDRTLHARLVDRLTRAGAKVIVFDIVFTDPNTANPAADQFLADAIKTSGRVILAADNVPIGPTAYQIKLPIELLETNAAGIGSSEVLSENDTTVRKHTPEDQIPSLSWVAAEFVKAKATIEPKQRQVDRWVNYYGGPGRVPGVSYYKALEPEMVHDDFFRGKAVFIGARMETKLAGERKDEYRNPFSVWLADKRGAPLIAGVEIQATAFLNLIRGDWLERLRFGTEGWLLVIIGAVFGIGLVSLRPLPAAGLAFGGLAVVIFACHLLFRHSFVWFPWLIVAVQVSVALGWSVLFNSVQLYVEKRLYQHTLGLYLSPKLVKKFSRNSALMKPGANKHELTLFFSDIADFTSISEGVDPDALAGMMNEYFQMSIAQCIHHTDGTVVKYIGDSIFAFWNAPELQDDHAFRACEAALHFRKVQVKAADGQLLRTRIGIHSGDANVGNFGSAERFDYTALGENVNLASRLEGLNKHLGTECLISSATKAEIGDRLVTRAVGSFHLKGFEKPVEIFELLDWPAEAEASRTWREAFEQALKNYQGGDFELAAMGFRQTLELHAGDGPAGYYLERLEEVGKQPAPADWTGATIMLEK